MRAAPSYAVPASDSGAGWRCLAGVALSQQSLEVARVMNVVPAVDPTVRAPAGQRYAQQRLPRVAAIAADRLLHLV